MLTTVPTKNMSRTILPIENMAPFETNGERKINFHASIGNTLTYPDCPIDYKIEAAARTPRFFAFVTTK